jgi:hypothetical protein
MTEYIAHLYNLLTTLHKPLYDTLCLLFFIIFDYHLRRLPQLSWQQLTSWERVTLRLWFTVNEFVLVTSLLRLMTSNIFQLNTCFHSPYITASLVRGWVCSLQLLVLASAVILRSDSRGTRDHILLSQIRDFPNLEGLVPVFISPRNRAAQLYP